MANAFTGVHRRWDRVGNLVPNFEHSDGIRPHISGAPAPWLPVQYYDKWYECWISIMAGKIVGLTRDEWLVPAGLKLDWNAAAGGDTVITYTANDVAELVYDITTGAPVTAATFYTKTQVTTALRSRGLIGGAENCDDYISRPIGVAAHCCYSWAFYDRKPTSIELTNAGIDSKFLNHYLQHKVAILCDYALRLPHVPAIVSGEALPGALTGGAPTLGGGTVHSAADTKLLTRFAALTGVNFVTYFSSHWPVATNTTRTPVTPSNTALMTRRRTSPNSLTAAGDFYIDYEVGAYFFYVSGGAALPATFAGTLTYYRYDGAPATVSNYICVVGDVWAGDFLECDVNSNFVVATNTTFRDILAQRLTSVQHPKDYLDRVKTLYTGLGTLDTMPGTATAGIPDNIVYAGGSDKEVVVNLISR